MAVSTARHAAERPDETALRDQRTTLTWAQADDLLNRAVNGLLTLDVGPERRIAVYAENSVETVLAHVAGLLAGMSVVPVNFHLTAPETAYILGNSRAAVLLTGPENVERAVAAAKEAGITRILAWRSGPAEGVGSWEEFLAGSSPAEPPSDLEPLPNLLYTSGTTGVPKATPLPPNMYAGGATVAEHVEALRAQPLTMVGPHLAVGPLYHTGPLYGVRAFAGGITLGVLGRFDAEAVLRAIEEWGIRVSVMVPTHFVRLLELPAEVRAGYDVSGLMLVVHTGSVCPADVKRAMIEWWGPVIVEAYGASEAGTVCVIDSHQWLEHPGSVGRPLPPFEVLVVDEEGRPLPPGAEGRLYFRDATGRGVLYEDDPGKTAAAHLEPGVFTLGEIGRVDDDGFVYITDRFSDMVVSGGVNIYPAEAERVLFEHPDVVDAACVGVPHPEMVEELKALVVSRNPGLTEGELIAFCRDRLTHYKCPRSVDFVSDLPRTAMGKLDKRGLRAPYWAG
ncbi:acyl-CoA synthetase [Actinomadura kijaniata]|uniref:Long-chain acyl-CoA synthetase n=1 Tax=Actinomadura namibiensis TaxID=182080 RepID=A0A7W3QMP8_ACTNM|nr:AMP-binding protein [Actinomadura namibiensis]MBA8952784.1 long-chain acyl-CoA synthetase [Actinomadura namibiensis]